MTAHVVAPSGEEESAAPILRYLNVYEDEHGRQWPGSLHETRVSADLGAADYVEDKHGKRRRVYVLRIRAPRGAVLVNGPWVPADASPAHGRQP